MMSEQGRAFFSGMIQNTMSKLGDGAVAKLGENMMLNDGLMKMMGSFTVLRLTSLLSETNISFTKEDLLAINAQLNTIPKVQ